MVVTWHCVCEKEQQLCDIRKRLRLFAPFSVSVMDGRKMEKVTAVEERICVHSTYHLCLHGGGGEPGLSFSSPLCFLFPVSPSDTASGSTRPTVSVSQPCVCVCETHATDLPTPLRCRVAAWKSASVVAFAARWICRTFAFIRFSSSLTPPCSSTPPPFAFALLITISERLYYTDFAVMQAAIKWMV